MSAISNMYDYVLYNRLREGLNLIANRQEHSQVTSASDIL